MAKVVVNSENFETEVLKAQDPVLVDFWATWCGPCKMLSPIVEQVSDEVEGVKVCALDVDEAGDIAQKYDVSAIPTLILFKNGEAVNRSVGFIPKEKVLALAKS